METASRHYVDDCLSSRWPYKETPKASPDAVSLPLLVRGVEKQAELLRNEGLELDERVKVLDNLQSLAADMDTKHRILQQNGILDLLVDLLADGTPSVLRSRTACLVSELVRLQPNVGEPLLRSLANLLCSGDVTDGFGVSPDHADEHFAAAMCFRVICESGRQGCIAVATVSPSILHILVGPGLRSTRMKTEQLEDTTPVPTFSFTPSTPRETHEETVPMNIASKDEDISDSCRSVVDILIALTCLARNDVSMAVDLVDLRTVPAALQFVAPSTNDPTPLLSSPLHTHALSLLLSLAATPSGQNDIIDLNGHVIVARVVSSACRLVATNYVLDAKHDDAVIDVMSIAIGILSLISTPIEGKQRMGASQEVMDCLKLCEKLYHEPPKPLDDSQHAQDIVANIIAAGDICRSTLVRCVCNIY